MFISRSHSEQEFASNWEYTKMDSLFNKKKNCTRNPSKNIFEIGKALQLSKQKRNLTIEHKVAMVF